MKRRKAAMLDEAEAILDKTDAEKRNLTTDEKSKYDSLMSKVKLLNNQILDEEERQAREMAEAEVITGESFYFPPGGVVRKNVAKGKPGGKTYRSLFYGNEHTPLDNGGFKTWNEFIEVVQSQRYDSRLTQPGHDMANIAVVSSEKRQFVGSDPGLGGFSVPEELTSWLMDRSLEAEIVRPRATVYPMEARTRRIPAWAGESHKGEYEEPFSLFGGFSPVWLEEAGVATDQIATLRQIVLTAYKLGLYTSVSNELAIDGLDFATQIEQTLMKAMSFTLDYYYLRGDGTNKPLGVLNCPSLIEVPREGAGAISFADVTNMYSRIHPVAATKATWVANYEVIPQLLTMTDTGGVNLVWKGNPNDFLGLPLIKTEKTPGLGDTGDLLLADFSHYAIGLRREMSIERSNAPGWEQDLSSYRILLRTDGRDTWAEPITPVEGADTLSWCVALGEAEGS
jgi:HK97 family phage major capsid protein